MDKIEDGCDRTIEVNRLLLCPEISVRVYFFEKANLGLRSDLFF